MENQELLDAVRNEIAAMLSQAYVLEDGCRVLKTEDIFRLLCLPFVGRLPLVQLEQTCHR